MINEPLSVLVVDDNRKRAILAESISVHGEAAVLRVTASARSGKRLAAKKERRGWPAQYVPPAPRAALRVHAAAERLTPAHV